MKYQIGEVVRFNDDTPHSGAFRLGGCLATITDAKPYGNYGDGTLAPGPVYKTAVTGDTWVHQDYFVPVNGGMKPAEESASDSPLTYRLGEVIRFADDISSQRAGKLNGKLATIVAVDNGDPATYQTAITADEWFSAEAFMPVNGGMPKTAEESTSEPEKESASDALPFSVKSLCDMVRALDDADLEALQAAFEEESRRRNERQQRKLAAAIVAAMDMYLMKVGDNCGALSMQRMHDAIIDAFDLTTQQIKC